MKLTRLSAVVLAAVAPFTVLACSDPGTSGTTIAAADTDNGGVDVAAGDVAGADSAVADGTASTEDDTVALAEDTLSTAVDTALATDTAAAEDTAVADTTPVALDRFSFFVTSLAALQDLSGSQSGFGGDLRYGETGPGAGLRGADKLCAAIAERSMPGASAKGWHAFLSAYEVQDGQVVTQVDAIDRVGDGPWYDRLGRLVAATKVDLIATRPVGADAAIINDLPNEDGVPNHRPDPTQPQVDNHDTLTGSNDQGRLYSQTATCNGWTGATGTEGKPRVGHSWPRSGGPGGGGGGPGGPGGNTNPAHWINSLTESGCSPGVNLVETGPPSNSSTTVGSGGGYGGFYCFADSE